MPEADLEIVEAVSEERLALFKKGTRLYSTATILLVLVAALHTLGLFNEPVDEDGVALVEAMRAYTVDVGMGMHPSVYDVQMSLGLTMPIFMVFLTLLSIVVLYGSPTAALLRRVTLVNAVCMWSLAVLYWVYQVFPPLISFVLVGVLYNASFVRSPTT